MNKQEKQAASSLALIFTFRMLGLFMILPIFSLYAKELKYSTAGLIGLALGIYGLTQAALQIPFGMLSDRFGRKPIITLGLIIFAVGSIVAALSHSIYGVIIGRALQGAGAIGSTIIAFISDLTREEHRTKAMAIVGLTIGLSFTLSMVIGPLLNHFIGIPGIFWLTASLACLGILILYKWVPKAPLMRLSTLKPVQFLEILQHPELLRLDLGIMSLHAILTALFIIVPIILQTTLQLKMHQQWLFYFIILLLSFLGMLPFMFLSEKKQKIKPVFLSAIFCLGSSLFVILLGLHSLTIVAIGMLLFFTAFTLLEATLPALISRIAPASSKGTAIGVYSCSQFFGIFIGGSIGGWVYGQYQINGIFTFTILLTSIWFIIASKMKRPKQSVTHMLAISALSPEQAANLHERLLALPEVLEVNVSFDQGTVYLKVDREKPSSNPLEKAKQIIDSLCENENVWQDQVQH